MAELFRQFESSSITFEDILHQINDIAVAKTKALNWPTGGIFLRKNDKSKNTPPTYSLCVSEPQQHFYPFDGYPRVTPFLKLFAPSQRSPYKINIELSVELFESVTSPQDAVYEHKERRKKKEDGSIEVSYYYRVTYSITSSHILNYIGNITQSFASSYRSKEPAFGCCHRYTECSDAKKCLHPNLMYSTACNYRKNLENGLIFYGKNRSERKPSEERQMSGRYISIDFETANPQRVSACSIGVAVIEDGEITKRYSSLIKPPDDYFAPMNVMIHHITPDMVVDAPTFDEIYPELRDLAAGSPIIGYSKFDRSVLKSLREYYDLPIDDDRIEGYVDVCEEVKRTFPNLKNHKLKTIAKHLGLDDFKHHDASDDAYICALVFIKLQCCRAPLVSKPQKQIPPTKEQISLAFSGFVDAILEDGIIDYKEVSELKHFLSIIPKSNTICDLMALIEKVLADGICDAEESAHLSLALTNAKPNIWN